MVKRSVAAAVVVVAVASADVEDSATAKVPTEDATETRKAPWVVRASTRPSKVVVTVPRVALEAAVAEVVLAQTPPQPLRSRSRL